MSEKKTKILISASGTGGHLIPAQQLAHKLKKNRCDVFFAASALSKRAIFQKDDFPYLDISTSILNKKTILFGAFKILKGLFQSLRLIMRYKPNVVVGFGSYHTFPVILASYILRKKIILFDSNSILGKVNRIFAKKALFVATQFELENKLQNEILTKRFPWNVRPDNSNAIEKTHLEKNVFTILIFGGSQGSQIINKNFIPSILDLRTEYKLQVIHILGKGIDIQKTQRLYDANNIKSYVSNFEKDLSGFYKLSDLVISRSGACSILEFIHFEKPSILIPFKGAKENHQLKNAIYMKNHIGASSIILEENISKDVLLNEMISFLKNDKKKLCLFKENIRRFKILDEKKNKKDLSDLVLEAAIK